MKPTLETVFDDDETIFKYLHSMNIDQLEKKLCVAEESMADVREELQDLVAFKNTIQQVLKEKRAKK
jgi:hypothetical protein